MVFHFRTPSTVHCKYCCFSFSHTRFIRQTCASLVKHKNRIQRCVQLMGLFVWFFWCFGLRNQYFLRIISFRIWHYIWLSVTHSWFNSRKIHHWLLIGLIRRAILLCNTLIHGKTFYSYYSMIEKQIVLLMRFLRHLFINFQKVCFGYLLQTSQVYVVFGIITM